MTHPPYNPDSNVPFEPRQPSRYNPNHTPYQPPRHNPRLRPTNYPRTEHTTQSHRNVHHPHKNKYEKPDTCDTSYDAVTIIRGELFIFKNRYLWRIGKQGLYAGYPHEINRLWNAFPADFTHIDAVYENKEHKIVFFVGMIHI